MSVCPPVFRIPCVPKLGPFSAVISQNVISQIKVVWYVFGVKNMHPGSSSDLSGTAAAEVKPRWVYPILKPHGQSFITSPESVQSSCVR